MVANKVEAPAEKPSTAPRHRSPNFPAMSLRKAVEKTEALYKGAKKFMVDAGAALKHLGYTSTKSSNSLQTVGALKAFGLIETDGSGESRRIGVSEVGAQILLGHPERATLLKKAALAPPLFAEVWELQTDDGLPPDDAIRNHLLWQLKFNEAAIPTFIAAFRDSLAYAGLADGDKVKEDGKVKADKASVGSSWAGGGDPPTPKVSVGDLVQWTANGSDMFEEPRPVLGVSEDGGYAFVPGTASGLPVIQLTVKGRAMNPESKTAPANPFAGTPAVPPKVETQQQGYKEDAYDLPEGRAVLRWPDKLDKDSVDELKDWFDLIIRKMQRTTGSSAKAKTEDAKT